MAPKSSGAPSGGVRLLKLRRLLTAGVSMVAVTAAVVAGGLWWRERPLRLAEQAIEIGDAKNAVRLAQAYLLEQPQSARGLAVVGRALVASGRPSEAIEIFEKIGAATAQDLHALARAHLMLGQFSAAHQFLFQSLEIEPNNADALYEITSCRLRMGLLQEAQKSADKLIRIPGNEARGWVLAGSIQADLGNFVLAADAYERVLEYEPEAQNLQVRDDELLFELGRMWLVSGQAAKAAPYLRRSVELFPSEQGYVFLGDALNQLHQTDKAIAAWKKVIEISPANITARESLANASLERGAANEALSWLQPIAGSSLLKSSTAYLFQRSHALLSHDAEAEQWRKKTDALRKREMIDSAIENLLVEDPQSFWSRVVLAHRFAANGNWQQAESLVEGLGDVSKTPFVVALVEAIKHRTKLPPVEQIPIKQF